MLIYAPPQLQLSKSKFRHVSSPSKFRKFICALIICFIVGYSCKYMAHLFFRVLLYCDSVTTEDLSSSSVPLRLLNTPNTASVTSSVSVLHLLKSHHLFEPTTHPTLSQLNIVIIIKGNRSKLFSINVFLLYDEKPHCYIISNSRRCQALNPTMDNSYTFLSNTQRSAFSGFECQESGPTDECQHALPE